MRFCVGVSVLAFCVLLLRQAGLEPSCVYGLACCCAWLAGCRTRGRTASIYTLWCLLTFQRSAALLWCCAVVLLCPALPCAVLCCAVPCCPLPCPALPCAALPCAVRMVCCCVCGVQGRLGWHVDGWWRTAPAAVIIRRRRKGQKALVEAKRVRGGVADRCALGFGLASPCLAYLAAGCCLPGSCVCHCATVFHACLRACPSASLRACVCLCVCSCVAFVSREWLVKPSVSPCA